MRPWELKGEVNLVSLEQLILKVSFLLIGILDSW